MTEEEITSLVASVARIIDGHAYDDKPPTDEHLRRQHIAERKAAEIIAMLRSIGKLP
jgi:hypothetical protein